MAAGQGTLALNRKAIDITRRNINNGFGLRELESYPAPPASLLFLQRKQDHKNYCEVSAGYVQRTCNKRPQRAQFGPYRRPSGAEFSVRQFGGPVGSAFAPPLDLCSDGRSGSPASHVRFSAIILKRSISPRSRNRIFHVLQFAIKLMGSRGRMLWE